MKKKKTLLPKILNKHLIFIPIHMHKHTSDLLVYIHILLNFHCLHFVSCDSDIHKIKQGDF